jgi:hypothetical protein
MATMSPAPSVRNSDASNIKPSFFNHVSSKASAYHARVPYISKLPFPAIAIIITLIVVNLLVWAAVGVVLVCPYCYYNKNMLTFGTSTSIHLLYLQQFSPIL